MNTILVVFGTRPEAIKMAPVIKEIEAFPKKIKLKVCVTGQHRELLDQVINLFDLNIDYDLNIMAPNQSLFDVSTKIFNGLERVLHDCDPNLVLVHGDTTTSMIAALSAFYKQIPVGHVEAGLRTNNNMSPWPEEMNRQLTGRIASYHFCPTELNKSNLIQENINEQFLFVTGNTVVDALLMVVNKLKHDKNQLEKVKTNLLDFGISEDNIRNWEENHRRLVLITGHRRESFGEGFINICNAIKELAELNPIVDFVYPVHLNPNVRNTIKSVFRIDGLNRNEIENIKFIEPLDYLPFVYLLDKSYLVLTDSGGVQEEAPGLGKPVLVMRENTERPEAVEAGTVKLVGTDKSMIVSSVNEILVNKKLYNQMSLKNNPYGQGNSAKLIVKEILNIFK